MNFIKTTKVIMILMLAAQASAYCAAGQPEQRSLWQRTKDFVVAHPIATGVIGTALAAGTYEVAARTFGLSTLDKVGVAAIEKIKTDTRSQMYAATALTAGAYSVVANQFGLPTITGTIKKDLITGSQGENINPAVAYHVLHALRLYVYKLLLSNILIKAATIACPSIAKPIVEQDIQGSNDTVKAYSFFSVALTGPIFEELLYTHAPYGAIALLNHCMNLENLANGQDAHIPIEQRSTLNYLKKSIKFVLPTIFAYQHDQYGLIGKSACFLASFVCHHSYQMRSEYPYSTIIAHILTNAGIYCSTASK